MRVSVIGCGHLGVPHATAMAELGHEVVGVDIDPARVGHLNLGESPIHEPGLPQLLASHTASGRLRFTTDFAEAAWFADVHFLAVDTPLDAVGRTYDTGRLFAAASALASHLSRPCTIIGKSTVAVGTTARLTALVEHIAPDVDIRVVWNPEFLREGEALENSLYPDRIIAGVTDAGAEKVIREVYAPLLDAGVPLLVTDPATAELAKGAANAFLGLKISFINAIADMCAAADADAMTLAAALVHDSRIGTAGLRPGLGYGGGCLPKDIRAFTTDAERLGVPEMATLLRAAEQINDARTARALDLIVYALHGKPVRDAAITIWGAAYKPGTDDVRESPALELAVRLASAGAHVRVHDPQANTTAAARHPELDYATDLEASCHGADVIVLATAWPQFRHADPRALHPLPTEPILVDLPNDLDPHPWRTAHWTVHQPGRPEAALPTPPTARPNDIPDTSAAP
ncbi:UDP-glucose dehydrogenase family protein [Embleya sp. NPDC059259]|uniref:UDP-glucose dehydrogenase family protein n=1 Tax=unclassified Embleya TaxID=2699296 RepID=UPI00368E47B5